MDLRWTADLPDLFQAATPPDGGRRCFLLVELLPFGGWEWLAWGQGGSPSLRGEANDRASAMRAAEGAIARLRDICNARPLHDRETLTLN